jgi:hypothetical protein
MTPIDSVARLATLIRRQMSGVPASRRMPSTHAPSRTRSGAADPGRDVESLVSRRVLEIESGDPRRREKVVRVFLEAVLLSELGRPAAADPGFAVLVTRVQHDMACAASLAAALDELVRLLSRCGDGEAG